MRPTRTTGVDVQNIICFVSDFGLEDTWVGVCHAVIHAACPQARVVDLGHQVPPFDIWKAAAIAAAGVYQLPEAIHLVVVDPGVGGSRANLCIVTNEGTRLIGPDNGVLLPAALRRGGICEVYAIDPSKIDYKAPLATFHARDIMAPAAAALVCGVEPSSLGRPLDPADLVPGPFETCRKEGEFVLAQVVDVDRFGSVRIGIGAEDLDHLGLQTSRLELGFGHSVIEAEFASTFSDVAIGEPVVLIDSSGWLTLAVHRDSAAERFGIEPSISVRVRPL